MPIAVVLALNLSIKSAEFYVEGVTLVNQIKQRKLFLVFKVLGKRLPFLLRNKADVHTHVLHELERCAC